jgi:hypothetical protein
VGFLQQNPLQQLVCQTVEDEVRFGPRNLGLGRKPGEDGLEELLAGADLRRLRGRPTQALSVGEQQRTALAATLSVRPQLLILDEPTMGQDRHHLRELMGLGPMTAEPAAQTPSEPGESAEATQPPPAPEGAADQTPADDSANPQPADPSDTDRPNQSSTGSGG